MGAEGIGGSLGCGGGKQKMIDQANGQKLKIWPPLTIQTITLAKNDRRTVGEQLGMGYG